MTKYDPECMFPHRILYVSQHTLMNRERRTTVEYEHARHAAVTEIRSILIATDFSEAAGYAARRGSAIARELGIGGRLVHVLPPSLPAQVHVSAAAQVRRTLALLSEKMERDGATFEPLLLSGTVADQIADNAGEHDLIVAGARGENLLLGFPFGRNSTRLIRKSRNPVLLVKSPPEGQYERVLVAVDFSRASEAAARYAAQAVPHARLELIHAFEVEFESTLRLAGVEQSEIHAYRHAARERALEEMEHFATALALPPTRLWRTVQHGYPPRVILEHEASTDAQLVVVGHSASRMEQLLLGSVAMEILNEANCDVLVVPQRAV